MARNELVASPFLLGTLAWARVVWFGTEIATAATWVQYSDGAAAPVPGRVS